jgi:hypothetical protein
MAATPTNALVELPEDMLTLVSRALVSAPSSLAALSLTCSGTRSVATKELSDVQEQWREWIRDAPKPFQMEASNLDDSLLVFLVDELAKEKVFPRLGGKDRKWLHQRAEQLGLTTTTVARSHRRGNTGDLVMRKPPQWQMNFGAPPKPTVGKMKTTPWRERTREWSGECDECGETLDAYNALYHYSGMGPLCEECVNADPELEGLKWEAKADFW